MTMVAQVKECNECGLSYHESVLPHQCAEWTKGRPVSDRCVHNNTPENGCDWCRIYTESHPLYDGDDLPAQVEDQNKQSELFPRYSFAVVTGRYKILDNRSDGPVRTTQIATADGETEARLIVWALNQNSN